LVLGVSQDKDIRGILKELLPSASRIILTKAQSPRALEPEAIKTFIKTNERPITLTSDSIRALEVARQNARREDLILVCGSLFLVGEVLKNQKQWN
jgi:dihydrofolate synthase/folylpolyglutamate synthase